MLGSKNARARLGSSNHCYLSDDIFHLFIDCDDIKLRQIFDGIDLMRREYPKRLGRAKFFVINSSLNRWHIASFVYLMKREYFDMLWYAVSIGLAHDGFAFYSWRKGYAVLRSGGAYGIVPRVMYSIGTNVSCKTDMKLFLKDRRWEG